MTANSEFIWVLRTSLYLCIINHCQIIDYEWQNTLNSSSFHNVAVLRLLAKSRPQLRYHCVQWTWDKSSSNGDISVIYAHDVCIYMYQSIVVILNSVWSGTFPKNENYVDFKRRFVISSWYLFVELDGRNFQLMDINMIYDNMRWFLK